MKNRIFVAVLCIVLSVGGIFAYTRSIQSMGNTMMAVTVTVPIRKGEQIDSSRLEVTEVGSYNMPAGLIQDIQEIVGQYALADFAPGDFILHGKVAGQLPTLDDRLQELDGSHVAVSVSLKSFPDSLADKIVSGDIVSCIVSEETQTSIPSALTYVEVLATTTASGVDKENAGDTLEENLSAATLLVTPYQAALLAGYDTTGSIRLALAYRGDADTARSFLEQQDALLEQLPVDSQPKPVVLPQMEAEPPVEGDAVQ